VVLSESDHIILWKIVLPIVAAGARALLPLQPDFLFGNLGEPVEDR
jgi:hypothetical protein